METIEEFNSKGVYVILCSANYSFEKKFTNKLSKENFNYDIFFRDFKSAIDSTIQK